MLPTRGSHAETTGMHHLVTVRTFTSLPEAQLACASLQAAGLDAELGDEHLVSMQWLYSQAIGGVKLRVPDDQAAEACEVLDTSAISDETVSLDPPEACPQCGSTEVESVLDGVRPAMLSLLLIGVPLAALDGFLARPGPASYLRAVRVVAEAHREWAVRQVRAARAGYALARGLATVRRELGPDAAEVLAALPPDERAGLRRRALALLASAHRELAGRVAGSAEQLRRQLALAKERTAQAAPAAPPRRRPPPRPGRR